MTVPFVRDEAISLSKATPGSVGDALAPELHPSVASTQWVDHLIAQRIDAARSAMGDGIAIQIAQELAMIAGAIPPSPTQPLPIGLEISLGLDDRFTEFDWNLAADNVDTDAVCDNDPVDPVVLHTTSPFPPSCENVRMGLC